MSLFKRFFLLGSVLLIAAFYLTISPVTLSAHAASVSASTHALGMTPSALSSVPRPQHELTWADAHTLGMTPSAVSPDFTCPSRTICFFQNNDFTGSGFSCATDVCNGSWFTVTFNGVHPGSVNDNSQSIFFAADKQAGLKKCFEPGRYPLRHTYGFFFIEFGIHSCNGAPVPPGP